MPGDELSFNQYAALTHQISALQKQVETMRGEMKEVLLDHEQRLRIAESRAQVIAAAEQKLTMLERDFERLPARMLFAGIIVIGVVTLIVLVGAFVR